MNTAGSDVQFPSQVLLIIMRIIIKMMALVNYNNVEP